MKNKKECEIVQDLLVNYVDDVLNPESKKLVEEHLIECNECERKLKQIKEDVNAIFAGEREVIRVNFGEFIIQ